MFTQRQTDRQTTNQNKTVCTQATPKDGNILDSDMYPQSVDSLTVGPPV